MTDIRRENRDLWESWSDDFQALWRSETDEGELPPAPLLDTHVMTAAERSELLAGTEGADVVELGCGGGQHSVAFTGEGAGSVTGLDLSSGQLRYARRLRDAYDVEARFVAGDAVELPFADDAFDFAFSSWALHMVDDLEACFAEVDRVLRRNGVFVLDVPHPFYEVFDSETRELEISYHSADRRRLPINDEYDADMIVFDRTVGDLHNALVDAGFTVERIVEPGSDDPDDYREDEVSGNRPELMAMVPRTILFRAVAE